MSAGLTALSGVRQSAWVSDVDNHLQAGLRQGERLAGAWLIANSTSIVLPPEGGGVRVVDDRFILPSGEGRLSVIAYDGLAGIPACMAQRGNALRTALPESLMGLVVPSITPKQTEQSAYLIDCIDLPDDTPRFPNGFLGRGRVWRTPEVRSPIFTDSLESPRPSLAEMISFHSDGRINLNTAPAPLLRAVYSVLHLGGVEEVLEHRRQLQPSVAPQHASPASNGLRLVAQSDRWQMLISVSWQGIHRSWWVDFVASSKSFTMMQRHELSY